MTHAIAHCECLTLDHVVRLSVWEHGEADFTFRLNHYRSWYARLWAAFRYALGLTTVDHFDTVQLTIADGIVMRDALNTFLGEV